jgi:hypothetical protein
MRRRSGSMLRIGGGSGVALLGVALSLLLVCGGCATIFAGANQHIIVESDPPGASVQIGPERQTTPATFTLPKGERYSVYAQLGKQVEARQLIRTFEPLSLFNLLFPPGFVVDWLTGAIYTYEPDNYVFTFDAAGTSSSQGVLAGESADAEDDAAAESAGTGDDASSPDDHAGSSAE